RLTGRTKSRNSLALRSGCGGTFPRSSGGTGHSLCKGRQVLHFCWRHGRNRPGAFPDRGRLWSPHVVVSSTRLGCLSETGRRPGAIFRAFTIPDNIDFSALRLNDVDYQPSQSRSLGRSFGGKGLPLSPAIWPPI